MNCKDILTTAVRCIESTDTVRQAAQLMRDYDIGFLPICDGRKAVGTVTDRDITLLVVADAKAWDTPLRELGLNRVVTCSPLASIDEGHRMMSKYQVSRLVCVDDRGEIVGVVSLSDLLPAMSAETYQATAKSIKRTEQEKSFWSENPESY